MNIIRTIIDIGTYPIETNWYSQPWSFWGLDISAPRRKPEILILRERLSFGQKSKREGDFFQRVLSLKKKATNYVYIHLSSTLKYDSDGSSTPTAHEAEREDCCLPVSKTMQSCLLYGFTFAQSPSACGFREES